MPKFLPAQEASIMLKLDVQNHDASPYKGPVSLRRVGSAEVLSVQTNEYGLAFVPVRPNSVYSLSYEGFKDLSRVRTKDARDGDLEISVTLPTPELRGKSVVAGRGVVIFTYTDTVGRPRPGQTLTCRDERGNTYRKVTERDGTLRIDLQLGHTYTFSVPGARNFETHTFPPKPALQTAEIGLRLGNKDADAVKTPPKSRRASPGPSVRERLPAPTAYRLGTKRDSATYAQRQIRAAVKGKRRQAMVIPPRRKQEPVVTKNVVQGVYMLKKAYLDSERRDPNLGRTIRMELFRPLLRSDYHDVVFVVDVTCSMDPYLEEYLLWLSYAKNSARVLGTVFFNDGDGISNAEKVEGQTGGIRFSKPDLESTAQALVSSIAYGCSGDDAENDCEALLFAQKRFPKAKSIVLVADNASSVRDIALLSQLKVPVHVFLCGQDQSGSLLPPHEDYVAIAVKTGGSLHSLNEDIEQKKLQMDSNALRIGKWEYRVLRGRFRRLN